MKQSQINGFGVCVTALLVMRLQAAWVPTQRHISRVFPRFAARSRRWTPSNPVTASMAKRSVAPSRFNALIKVTMDIATRASPQTARLPGHIMAHLLTNGRFTFREGYGRLFWEHFTIKSGTHTIKGFCINGDGGSAGQCEYFRLVLDRLGLSGPRATIGEVRLHASMTNIRGDSFTENLPIGIAIGTKRNAALGTTDRMSATIRATAPTLSLFPAAANGAVDHAKNFSGLKTRLGNIQAIALGPGVVPTPRQDGAQHIRLFFRATRQCSAHPQSSRIRKPASTQFPDPSASPFAKTLPRRTRRPMRAARADKARMKRPFEVTNTST